jgi:hypothetical protein
MDLHNCLSLYLNTSGYTYDVPLSALLQIEGVLGNDTMYNWFKHLVSIFKEIQEKGKTVRFPSLIIYMVTQQVQLVRVPKFTEKLSLGCGNMFFSIT